MFEPDTPARNASNPKAVAESGPADVAAPIMPEHAEPIASGVQTDVPSSVRSQVAQLIVIPALIMIAGIGVALLFVWVASGEENIEDQLARLRGCSGSGRGPMGFQSARYKDCWHAAFNITGEINHIYDPKERTRLSEALVQILDEQVSDEEGLLQRWLLEAIGRLGRDGDMSVLINWLDAPRAPARHGALIGLLAWPDQCRPRGQRAARSALPEVSKLLADQDPHIAMIAAAALGELAESGDTIVIQALQLAMEEDGLARRYVRWNAAVALARLGDDRGGRVVAGLLLDRQELAKRPDLASGEPPHRAMAPYTQDEIILSTLAAAGNMTDASVWNKIRLLADNDQSDRVKAVARQLLLEQDRMKADD